MGKEEGERGWQVASSSKRGFLAGWHRVGALDKVKEEQQKQEIPTQDWKTTAQTIVVVILLRGFLRSSESPYETYLRRFLPVLGFYVSLQLSVGWYQLVLPGFSLCRLQAFSQPRYSHVRTAAGG